MSASLPARVLIVRLGAIGDVVNALVLASALRAQAPRTRIGWVVHELSLPLVQGHPALARVHVWRKGTGLAGFRAVLREIRAEHYDLAIDLQRIAKSATLARLSGAPRVLGFDRARAKEASWLLAGEHIAPAPASAHMVDQYLEFARHLGLADAPARFERPHDAAARERAAALVRELGAAPIAMHLGATKPANRWAPERFGALARACIERFGAPVVFTGGADERAAAALAIRADARIRDLVGATSLLELAELQALSRLVISCDSGPMHLAASVGARVLALFGASDERRTGPWGTRHRVVRTRPECAPCGLRRCSQPRHHCMEDLDVERVLAAAAAMLDP